MINVRPNHEYDGENSERKGKFIDPNDVSKDGRDLSFDTNDRLNIDDCEEQISL